MKMGDERCTIGCFDCNLDAAPIRFELGKTRREAQQTRTRAATANSGFDFITATYKLAPFERQPERGHLVIVANQQNVAGKHRMIPRLPL